MTVCRLDAEGWLLRLAACICGAFLILLPIGWPVVSALTDTDAWHQTVSDLPRTLNLLVTTVELAGLVLLGCLPAGFIIAVALTRYRFLGRKIWWFILLVVGFSPILLYAGGWLALTGPMGVMSLPGSQTSRWGGLFSAAIVHILAAIAWSTALLALGLRTVPRSWQEQALLETDDRQVLLRICLPNCLAAIVAAGILCIVPVLTDMSATDLFVVRTLAEEAYTQFETGGNSHTALLLNIPVMVVVAGCLVTALFFWRKGATVEENCAYQYPFKDYSIYLAAWFLLTMYALPVAGLVRQLGLQTDASDLGNTTIWTAAVSTSYLQRAIVEAFEQGRLLWDLWRAILAAALATASAICLAWQFVFISRPLQWTALGVLTISYLLPGPVLGVTVIDIFNRPGILGWIYDGTGVLIFVQAVRTLPYAATVVAAAFLRVDRDLLESARCEGAGQWSLLSRIAIPCQWPMIALAFILSLAFSLNELAASKLVAPPGVEPMALRTFLLLHGGTSNEQAAQCLVLLATITLLALPAYGFVTVLANRTVQQGIE